MGLAALSSIFGIVACIVGIKSWRTSSNPSKAWLIVVAVVSVVLGFATAWPFVQNQLSLNNYAKTSIEEKVSSYVSYETARDEIMSCKIDYVTVLALGISNGKDGYYMVLGTRWDYDTYGTRYGSTTDQYGDAIRLYLAYEYKDAIK
jgi:hypothetical protein